MSTIISGVGSVGYAQALRGLQQMATVMGAQAKYAKEVGGLLNQAIKMVDNDYLRAVLGLTQEFVYAQSDVMLTYVDFNTAYVGLRMRAIEEQLQPEKGNYMMSTYG